MKRIVIGTHSQCMSVIRRSNEMGIEGYDYFELRPTTFDEYMECVGSTEAKKRFSQVYFYKNSKHLEHLDNDNLFILFLYRNKQLEL